MPETRTDRYFQNTFANVGASLLRWIRFPSLVKLGIERINIFEAISQPSFDNSSEIPPTMAANFKSIGELKFKPRHFFDSYSDQRYMYPPLRVVMKLMPLRKLEVDGSNNPRGIPFMNFIDNDLLRDITLSEVWVPDEGLSWLLHKSPHLKKLKLHKVWLVGCVDSWQNVFDGLAVDQLETFDIMDLSYTGLKHDNCPGTREGKTFLFHTSRHRRGNEGKDEDVLALEISVKY